MTKEEVHHHGYTISFLLRLFLEYDSYLFPTTYFSNFQYTHLWGRWPRRRHFLLLGAGRQWH